MFCSPRVCTESRGMDRKPGSLQNKYWLANRELDYYSFQLWKAVNV
jgi:hypothetical protein